ncbi:MAG: peptidase, partial [Myxococcales bacterium]
DGVGAGRSDPVVNPLARHDALLSWFSDGAPPALPAGGQGRLVDACLGVEGRPQSATGQTAILTGVNAPRSLGHHLLGFPNAPLRRILDAHSLFAALRAAGVPAAFANPYPLAYLHAFGLPHQPHCAPEPTLPIPRRRLRTSASTCAVAAAGLPFRTFADARRGLALPHDLTGQRARERGFDVPELSPREAAQVLLRIGEGHGFVLFEHFLLDELGHARALDDAVEELARYDAFLRALVAGLGPEDHLLVVSDHGNVEDLSVRSHSRNPVPFLAFGPRAAALVASVRALTDVRAAVFAACGAVDPAPPPEIVHVP